MSEKNRAKECYINNRDIILNRAKEYINSKESIKENPKIKDYQKEYRKTMTDEKKQKMKDYQKEYKKEYRKNMTDEQKQRYKEARNKHDKDKYHNMTDEERQKRKEYQKEYRKNMTDEQKRRYKENRNKCKKDITDKEYKEVLNNEKIITTIIKDNDHFSSNI